jgi:hypothetical protein
MDTTQFGMSTISLILRSPATLQIAYAYLPAREQLLKREVLQRQLSVPADRVVQCPNKDPSHLTMTGQKDQARLPQTNHDGRVFRKENGKRYTLALQDFLEAT